MVQKMCRRPKGCDNCRSLTIESYVNEANQFSFAAVRDSLEPLTEPTQHCMAHNGALSKHA